MGEHRREWEVGCGDAAGRNRTVRVVLEGGKVCLTAPPGEVARLSPLEVGRLRAVLRDAVAELGQQAARRRAEEDS